MPWRRKNAEYTASALAIAPVWEAVLALPASVQPVLYATTGFPAARARAAAAAKASGRRITSTNRQMTRQAGSSAA
jgi:hypothetical protein